MCMGRLIVCKRVHLWAEPKHPRLGRGAALFLQCQWDDEALTQG